MFDRSVFPLELRCRVSIADGMKERKRKVNWICILIWESTRARYPAMRYELNVSDGNGMKYVMCRPSVVNAHKLGNALVLYNVNCGRRENPLSTNVYVKLIAPSVVSSQNRELQCRWKLLLYHPA